jgi:hypothetical protein
VALVDLMAAVFHSRVLVHQPQRFFFGMVGRRIVNDEDPEIAVQLGEDTLLALPQVMAIPVFNKERSRQRGSWNAF